jgi:hypothetical protein
MSCSENYACAVRDCKSYACAFPAECADQGLIYSEFHTSFDVPTPSNHVTEEGKIYLFRIRKTQGLLKARDFTVASLQFSSASLTRMALDSLSRRNRYIETIPLEQRFGNELIT